MADQLSEAAINIDTSRANVPVELALLQGQYIGINAVLNGLEEDEDD